MLQFTALAVKDVVRVARRDRFKRIARNIKVAYNDLQSAATKAAVAFEKLGFVLMPEPQNLLSNGKG